jgi:adenylosuccinate synthase
VVTATTGSLILVLSGPVGAGKTTLAQGLAADVGAAVLHTRAIIEERAGSEPRASLQAYGEELDRNLGGSWVADPTLALRAEAAKEVLVVVDAVRTAAQIRAIRDGARVTHVHLTARDAVLRSRFRTRSHESLAYEQVRANPTEAAVDRLADDADLVLDTGTLNVAQTRKRVLTFLA